MTHLFGSCSQSRCAERHADQAESDEGQHTGSVFTVSILLATNRPQDLDQAIANIRLQTIDAGSDFVRTPWAELDTRRRNANH